jgi:thiol-disulfide isomerase/thioredoxin
VNRGIVWLGLVVAAVVAAAIVAPFFTSRGSQGAGPSGLAGQSAPVFALHDDTGAAASLAEYRGKVVVMNLWASWCPPCRAEMPELQQFADAYATRGVAVVGVNQGESAARALAFARSLRIRFPVWLDERQQYGRAFTALGLPTTVVVARDGVVAAGFDGQVSIAQLRAAVAAAAALH